MCGSFVDMVRVFERGVGGAGEMKRGGGRVRGGESMGEDWGERGGEGATWSERGVESCERE